MSNTKNLKVVLATGIFFPDIGGPAIHVRRIAEALVMRGYKPVVISYGDYSGSEEFPFKTIRVSNKLPTLLRRLLYSSVVLKESFGASALYAFNLTTAGIPVFFAGKILRKKILIRVAGDPIWERIVEKGKRFVSFEKYYEQGLQLVDKPMLYKLIRYTLPRFDAVIFYTPLLSKIYQKYYDVYFNKIRIILNPVSRRQLVMVKHSEEPTILFAGRFVAYKNLEIVIRAFDKVRQRLNRGRLVLIGEGPDREKLVGVIRQSLSASHMEVVPKVDQQKLFNYICSSTVGIGPALTEFNPNFILECLSFGKPVLLSRENGLSVQLPDEFLFDAANEQELETKLTKFFDEEFYRTAVKSVANMDLNQTWDNVVGSHITILNEVLCGQLR